MSFSIHSFYNDSTMTNDLCLLRLSQPFHKSDKVSISQISNQWSYGSNCKVLGWGRTENTLWATKQLRVANVTILPPVQCVFDVKFDPDAQICAGGKVL